MEPTCPLCRRIGEVAPICANRSAVAIWDAFPVSPGHALIISRRHEADLFCLPPVEVAEAFSLLPQVRQAIEDCHDPDGYNIGINIGSAAGQTVAHVHIHVIPRYRGDVDDPRGGVRWVVPEKADYWTSR